ncbi:unnamed protein product [Moneuplotes crassus]|uniref:Importin N-terminal domain-containing protein n=1 Tax=Euplotes crassus TaxID=5936 RepID=A0AAD2D386_EUPCR|nr:unnamed protein product [Moneuplotes crassus]
MDSGEFGVVKELLLQVMASDNEVRREAENKLTQVRQANFDKYFAYMVTGFADQGVDLRARAMALILLRRDILENNHEEPSVWSKLTGETREYIKAQILEVLANETDPLIVNKIAEFAAKIAIAINDVNYNDIWLDLFNLCKRLISEGNETQTKAGLVVYAEAMNGLSNEIVVNDADLYAMFEVTLKNENIEISLASLKAIRQFLTTVMPKHAIRFVGLLGDMVNISVRAIKSCEYKVLEESMEVLIAIIEAEPKFFLNDFPDLLQVFTSISEQSQHLNETLKKLPVELLISIVERDSSLLTRNEDYLKQILDLTFTLILEEAESDTIVFGRKFMDRLCSCASAEYILAPICTLVKQAVDHKDWKQKQAGLNAFSQIGEYVSEIEQISEMIPTVIEHCKHEHPKVRHAAVHCLGQFATDLKHQLTENYHEAIIPTLYEAMNDKVNRVKAHASGCMSNFLENASQEIGLKYCEGLLGHLFKLIKSESGYLAANAVTCIASLAQSCDQEFNAYFDSFCNELLPIITQKVPKDFRRFKGQAIESLTISAVCIGLDNFRFHSEKVAKALILILKNHLDEIGDPQRKYILGGFQRLALIMEKEFAPILPEIMPDILKMASLYPKFRSTLKVPNISENYDEDQDLMNEDTNPDESDEIEEIDIITQILCVFIDELKELYAPYIEQTSELFVSLSTFSHSDKVRQNASECLPKILKIVKKCENENMRAQLYGEKFIDILYGNLKIEGNVSVMKYQINAIKDCIDEVGDFLSEDQINQMSEVLVEMISKSDRRKDLNNKFHNENGQGESEIDEMNRGFLDEENQEEDDLQISISETFGVIFKTHKNKCGVLASNLLSDLVSSYIDENASFAKQKFGVYLICDAVEYLGPDILGTKYQDCLSTFVRLSKSTDPLVRHGSVYGLGVSSITGGDLFAQYSVDALEILKEAIEMEPGSQDISYYNHARDNAVSAFAKILKYQHAPIDTEAAFEYLLQHVPLRHDMIESKLTTNFIIDTALNNPTLFTSNDHQNTPQLITFIQNLSTSSLASTTLTNLQLLLSSLSSDPTAHRLLSDANISLPLQHP